METITDQVIEGVGSMEMVIKILAGDNSENAKDFISTYNKLSDDDRSRLSLEEIFTAAGLSPREFIAVLSGAALERRENISRLLTAVSQPKVIASTIKAAIESLPIMDAQGEVVGYTNGDMKAQEMFHKATGWLPTPKGAQTFIVQNNSSPKDEDEDEVAPALESMDSFLMGMQDVLRPQLPAPSTIETVPTRMPKNAPDLAYIDADI